MAEASVSPVYVRFTQCFRSGHRLLKAGEQSGKIGGIYELSGKVHDNFEAKWSDLLPGP